MYEEKAEFKATRDWQHGYSMFTIPSVEKIPGQTSHIHFLKEFLLAQTSGPHPFWIIYITATAANLYLLMWSLQ